MGWGQQTTRVATASKQLSKWSLLASPSPIIYIHEPCYPVCKPPFPKTLLKSPFLRTHTNPTTIYIHHPCRHKTAAAAPPHRACLLPRRRHPCLALPWQLPLKRRANHHPLPRQLTRARSRCRAGASALSSAPAACPDRRRCRGGARGCLQLM